MELKSELTVPVQGIMEWFVRKALKLGWTRDKTSGILVDQKHPSKNWAAEWKKYTVDNVTYTVPHWLPKVIDEQLEALLPQHLYLRDLQIGEKFTLKSRDDGAQFIKINNSNGFSSAWINGDGTCFIEQNTLVERVA